jgi:transposase
MLPKDFPAWQTVYDYYLKWRHNGKWDLVHEILRERVREAAGKKPLPTLAIVDSRSVKTAQKGGSVALMRAKR